MMALVSGIIGIVMLVGFLGMLVWWIRALPFAIIVVVVLGMMIYDFVQTLRHGEGGGER